MKTGNTAKVEAIVIAMHTICLAWNDMGTPADAPNTDGLYRHLYDADAVSLSERDRLVIRRELARIHTRLGKRLPKGDEFLDLEAAGEVYDPVTGSPIVPGSRW